MVEEFEKDCEHTAQVIIDDLDAGEKWSSFLLYDVNAELFDKHFIPKVAKYLGGIVGEDETIIYKDITISFSFTVSNLICGCFEDLEVSAYFTRTS